MGFWSNRACRRLVDKADSRCTVGELCGRFAAGVALHQPSAAWLLSRGGGLAGNAEFPYSGDGLVLDHLRSGAAGRPTRQFSSDQFSPDGGVVIRGCDTDGTL